MATNSFISSLAGGFAPALGYNYYKKKEKKQDASIAAAEATAQTQKNIAEDERLRRLRLLQGGTTDVQEAATGRKTLLGQ